MKLFWFLGQMMYPLFLGSPAALREALTFQHPQKMTDEECPQDSDCPGFKASCNELMEVLDSLGMTVLSGLGTTLGYSKGFITKVDIYHAAHDTTGALLHAWPSVCMALRHRINT